MLPVLAAAYALGQWVGPSGGLALLLGLAALGALLAVRLGPRAPLSVIALA